MDAELLKPSGWIGAKVTEDNRTILAMFRSGAPAGKTVVEGFTTDANRFAVETSAGRAVKNLYLRGTLFEGMGVMVRSSKPAPISVSYSVEMTELEAESKGMTIALRVAKEPVEVNLNGASPMGWMYDEETGELRLTLPEGHNLLKVK
jgi:hypothetical protein